MKNKTNDTRPRFGWCDDLDLTPQHIYEDRAKGYIPVVVIPLPFMAPKQKKAIREFAKSLWPRL